MATGSLSQHDLSETAEAGQIADVLQSNCRRWKLLDLLTMLSRSALAGLVLLGSAFLIDHWAYLLVDNGSLGSLGRWLYFLLLVILFPPASIYFIGCSLRGRINPLYVAQQIEAISPEIRNSVSNYWQIKDSNYTHPSIAQSMEKQAYLDLDNERALDGADATTTSWWGYSSLASMAVTAIYFACMPNPSLQTMHRILIPWDDVQRPSEIIIDQIEPGEIEINYGATVTFSAKVDRISEGQPVHLITKSLDGTSARQKHLMMLNNNKYEFTLDEVPHGIQQSFRYWIEAGDPSGRTALSKQFKVQVIPAPSIRVTQVKTTRPAYTNLPASSSSTQFNLEALEGSRVQIHATANAAIDSAWLLLRTRDGGSQRQAMEVTDELTAASELELRVDSEQIPLYSGYQVFFKSKSGKTNPHAIEYSITTLQDLAPLIEFTQPASREVRNGPVELAANQTLQLEWEAYDPDFALSSVSMVITRQAHDDIRVELLEPTQSQEMQRRFNTKFTPTKLGLTPGTRITLYGEAADNRKTVSNPRPNQSQSEHLVIHVTAPVDTPETPDEENGTDDGDMTQQPSDNMEDAPNEMGSEEGMAPDGGSNSSGEGETGGSSQNSEEGGEPNNENGGSGGQGNPSEESNDGKGENASADRGGPPSDTNDGNSDNDMPGDNNPESEAGTDTGNAGTGESSNNSDSGESGNDSNAQDTADTGESIQSSDESVSGQSTGESGNQNNSGNTPEREGEEGGAKSDDKHDGDIFDKLLDRLRDMQNQESPTGDTPSNEPPQTPPMNQGDENPTEQSSNEKPATTDGNSDSMQSVEGQPNTQTDSGKPKTGDPANQQADDASANPDAQGMNTKDPMKDPRNGDVGDSGEQVEDMGGSDTDTTQTGGPQQSEKSDMSAGDENNPNGENVTDTPGTQESTDSPGATDHSAGAEANSQSGTGQQDAEQVDNLGLPEQIDESEEAQLEYAKRATDLALKYLRDHQDNPSDDLLEDLGITAEQLREMVARYEALQQDTTDAGKTVLSDTLKSLGLRPTTQSGIRQVKSNQQDVQGVRGSGALSGLPAHLQHRFKSFRTGTNVSDE